MNSFKINDFVKSEAFGGVLLLASVALSLLIANSGAGAGFNHILQTDIGFSRNYVHLKYPVLFWINDGLMAVFFLFVGLEIKRELIGGELSTTKKAVLPIFAAFGGAILPAAIFCFINSGRPTAHGWGIPMATDIAFALGILALLGSRVPSSLKIFLSALAIVDDLIAIIVIALFYAQSLNLTNMFFAAGIFFAMLIFNKAGLKSIVVYLIAGLFLWYFLHNSGIHATIAGVLVAIAIPASQNSIESPLEKLEHFLSKPVNFLIMPVFALANTNISFEQGMVESLSSPLALGILFGLAVGKPLGITVVSWAIVKLGFGVLPNGVKWRQIAGVGLLGGIGFTMSLFITLLSFNETDLRITSKFAVLIASVLSGIAGYLVLKMVGNQSLIEPANSMSKSAH